MSDAALDLSRVVKKLGKYEVTERLGRGGMAEVYRAYHASLDRYVAIKVLHAFLADDPEFKNRFEKEARNIARLRHPNIVQVYDFDYDPESESYYMVMELVEGSTLKDRLYKAAEQGRIMTYAEALRIVREAASALAYAHAQNMVHRDVKPGNLMIDHDDRVVLTDFGIAKIVTGAQFTATGGMVGTPAYMSPEQGVGEAGDERSDLYSLGVILFQLVTGRLPYDAETPLAVILKHLNDPVPSARDFNPRVPIAVEQVTYRLMSKDPAARYQTALELIAEIEHVERGDLTTDGGEISFTPPLSTANLDTLDLEINEGGDASHHTPLPSVEALTGEIVPPQRGVPGWLIGVLLLILVVGGYLLGATQGVFPLVGTLPSETPTATATATVTASLTATEVALIVPEITELPTDTPEPTETASPTATPTETPTVSASPRPSRTPGSTPTDAPTRRPTATYTPSITFTPTVDITQTVIQLTAIQSFQTATIAACEFDYEIIEQNPPDADYYPNRSTYTRAITFRNTGTCPWERNTALWFISGESFNAGPQIFIRERVEVGERYTLQFEGDTPSEGGLLSGIWELRTPGLIPVGERLQISIQVFDRGVGN